MTDKEMTDRLLARDESVLSEIDCQLGGMITRVALNITGDPRDAEEIRYDVLRKLWESIPPARPDSVAAWAAMITRRLAINRLNYENAKKRRGTLPLDELTAAADDSEISDRITAKELGRAISDFLTTLSEHDRRMFVLRYVTAETPEMIAGKLGIDISTLGKVYESPEITGYLSEEIADLTGLPAGIPVVAGAGDNAAAAVGEGVVRNGRAFTTIGTSGVVFAHSDEIRIDPEGRVHTFCCAVPGAWHVMGVTQAAGLSLRWLRDNVCTEETNEAKEKGVDPYDIMCAEAGKTPVGADRLIYLPYLMGERTPHLDPDCRGAFVGLSAVHTRAHMIRAVLEGVCYSLNDCLSVLSEMGVVADDMKVCGGGGKSEFWRQMLADVYGIPVSTVESDEGPSLGAAILAMVGAGIYGDVCEACETVVRTKETVTPDMNRGKEYKKFYGVYDALYGHLKDDFGALAKL